MDVRGGIARGLAALMLLPASCVEGNDGAPQQRDAHAGSATSNAPATGGGGGTVADDPDHGESHDDGDVEDDVGGMPCPPGSLPMDLFQCVCEGASNGLAQCIADGTLTGCDCSPDAQAFAAQISPGAPVPTTPGTTPAPDGGTSSGDYSEPCDDEAPCVDGLACIFGLCTRECGGDPECADLGERAACVAGTCLDACVDSLGCSPGLICTMVASTQGACRLP